jgi:hypothetical protein
MTTASLDKTKFSFCILSLRILISTKIVLYISGRTISRDLD